MHAFPLACNCVGFVAALLVVGATAPAKNYPLTLIASAIVVWELMLITDGTLVVALFQRAQVLAEQYAAAVAGSGGNGTTNGTTDATTGVGLPPAVFVRPDATNPDAPLRFVDGFAPFQVVCEIESFIFGLIGNAAFTANSCLAIELHLTLSPKAISPTKWWSDRRARSVAYFCATWLSPCVTAVINLSIRATKARLVDNSYCDYDRFLYQFLTFEICWDAAREREGIETHRKISAPLHTHIYTHTHTHYTARAVISYIRKHRQLALSQNSSNGGGPGNPYNPYNNTMNTGGVTSPTTSTSAPAPANPALSIAASSSASRAGSAAANTRALRVLMQFIFRMLLWCSGIAVLSLLYILSSLLTVIEQGSAEGLNSLLGVQDLTIQLNLYEPALLAVLLLACFGTTYSARETYASWFSWLRHVRFPSLRRASPAALYHTRGDGGVSLTHLNGGIHAAGANDPYAATHNPFAKTHPIPPQSFTPAAASFNSSADLLRPAGVGETADPQQQQQLYYRNNPAADAAAAANGWWTSGGAGGGGGGGGDVKFAYGDVGGGGAGAGGRPFFPSPTSAAAAAAAAAILASPTASSASTAVAGFPSSTTNSSAAAVAQLQYNQQQQQQYNHQHHFRASTDSASAASTGSSLTPRAYYPPMPMPPLNNNNNNNNNNGNNSNPTTTTTPYSAYSAPPPPPPPRRPSATDLWSPTQSATAASAVVVAVVVLRSKRNKPEPEQPLTVLCLLPATDVVVVGGGVVLPATTTTAIQLLPTAAAPAAAAATAAPDAVPDNVRRREHAAAAAAAVRERRWWWWWWWWCRRRGVSWVRRAAGRGGDAWECDDGVLKGG
ncbi:hypothetical protein DFJ73DRAFT_911331 [Zopfochytrium polystomum]|nr:hypothetical protein DFJ73DRAFT_911331 [Zopfochytrium polystomum]